MENTPFIFIQLLNEDPTTKIREWPDCLWKYVPWSKNHACSEPSFQAKHLLVLLTLLQRFSGTTWMFSLNVPSSEFWQDTLVSYSSSFPIFPPLFLHVSPPIRALAVWRARRTRRGLGDVLAALRTTPGLRQPSVEGHFAADLDMLLNSFICGKSIFGTLLKTFFSDPFSDESQTASSHRRVWLLFSSGHRDWEEWERYKHIVDRTDSTYPFF